MAIKSIKRDSDTDVKRSTLEEMSVLQSIKHPNVIGIYDSFETQKHMCFVMELCSGGDLFSYIQKRRRLKEQSAKYFFKQII